MPVIGSILLSSTGPIPRQVTVPGIICVNPASVMRLDTCRKTYEKQSVPVMDRLKSDRGTKENGIDALGLKPWISSI